MKKSVAKFVKNIILIGALFTIVFGGFLYYDRSYAPRQNVQPPSLQYEGQFLGLIQDDQRGDIFEASDVEQYFQNNGQCPAESTITLQNGINFLYAKTDIRISDFVTDIMVPIEGMAFDIAHYDPGVSFDTAGFKSFSDAWGNTEIIPDSLEIPKNRAFVVAISTPGQTTADLCDIGNVLGTQDEFLAETPDYGYLADNSGWILTATTQSLTSMIEEFTDISSDFVIWAQRKDNNEFVEVFRTGQSVDATLSPESYTSIMWVQFGSDGSTNPLLEVDRVVHQIILKEQQTELGPQITIDVSGIDDADSFVVDYLGQDPEINGSLTIREFNSTNLVQNYFQNVSDSKATIFIKSLPSMDYIFRISAYTDSSLVAETEFFPLDIPSQSEFTSVLVEDNKLKLEWTTSDQPMQSYEIYIFNNTENKFVAGLFGDPQNCNAVTQLCYQEIPTGEASILEGNEYTVFITPLSDNNQYGPYTSVIFSYDDQTPDPFETYALQNTCRSSDIANELSAVFDTPNVSTGVTNYEIGFVDPNFIERTFNIDLATISNYDLVTTDAFFYQYIVEDGRTTITITPADPNQILKITPYKGDIAGQISNFVDSCPNEDTGQDLDSEPGQEDDTTPDSSLLNIAFSEFYPPIRVGWTKPAASTNVSSYQVTYQSNDGYTGGVIFTSDEAAAHTTKGVTLSRSGSQTITKNFRMFEDAGNVVLWVVVDGDTFGGVGDTVRIQPVANGSAYGNAYVKTFTEVLN